MGPRFIKTFVMKQPYSVSLFITNKCNSKCSFCNIWKETPKKDLNKEELKKILSKSNLLKNVQQFNLTGGEPFLNNNLEEIIDLLIKYSNPLKISIVTNGLLQTIPEKVKQITKKYGRKKFRFKISLDAANKKVYKKVRGVDGYGRVVKNIEIMIKKGLDVSLGFTITSNNFSELKELIKKYEKRVIAHPVEEIKYYHAKIKSDKMLKKFRKLKHQNKVFQVYYYFLSKAIPKKHRIHKCYAGQVSLCLDQNLEVFSCIKNPVKFGNLKDFKYDFDKLWKLNIKRVKQKVEKCTEGCYCTGDVIPSIFRNFSWVTK